MKVVWLIERGRLCVGKCRGELRLVTLTDEDALHFSTQAEAEKFRAAQEDLDSEAYTIAQHGFG